MPVIDVLIFSIQVVKIVPGMFNRMNARKAGGREIIGKRWQFLYIKIKHQAKTVCRDVLERNIFCSSITLAISTRSIRSFDNLLFKFNVSLPLVTGKLLQNTLAVNNETYKLYNIKSIKTTCITKH